MSEQLDQFNQFLRREKALCVIEQRKCHGTFALVMRRAELSPDTTRGFGYSVYHTHIWHSPEGIEAVLAWKRETIERYLNLLHEFRSWSQWPKIMRAKLGRMFGYTFKEVAEFNSKWTPEFCQCSKCVGIKRALEVKEERRR